jgi:hypothetical protein
LKIRVNILNLRCTTGVNDTNGKWKKSAIRKVLNILFGHLWVAEFSFFFSSLPSVSILILFSLFAASINDTSGNRGKIAAGVVDTGWCTMTCKYLSEFLKKFEMTLILFSETWRKMIHEKYLKQTIL